MGNILDVHVHATNIHDTNGGVSTFEVIPKRWRIERTFSWFGGYRRLSKDFKYSVLSEENIVYISHIHLLLKRL